MKPASLYGIVGSFASADELRAAVGAVRSAGFGDWETFTPYAVEGVEPPEKKAKAGRRSPVARAMAFAAVFFSSGAFALQEWGAYDYPVNVGGRPLNSWPAFIPITFELTVLGTALTGMVTFFILAGFPRLHHPLFSVPEFRRATQDRFFLLLKSPDLAAAKRFLAQVGAETIDEVDA